MYVNGKGITTACIEVNAFVIIAATREYEDQVYRY